MDFRSNTLAIDAELQHRAADNECPSFSQAVEPPLWREGSVDFHVVAQAPGNTAVRPVGSGSRRDFKTQVEIVEPQRRISLEVCENLREVYCPKRNFNRHAVRLEYVVHV